MVSVHVPAPCEADKAETEQLEQAAADVAAAMNRGAKLTEIAERVDRRRRDFTWQGAR